MEKASGIGGIFFRARDPGALARRCDGHLGISPVPANYDELPWWQEAGPSGFAPFPETMKYFGDDSKTWNNLLILQAGELPGHRARGSVRAVGSAPSELLRGNSIVLYFVQRACHPIVGCCAS